MVLLDKNSKKKIYQILKNIKGLSNSNSKFICKKFGFQPTCTLNNLENSDFEQLKNYLSNNYLLDKPLIETVNKNVKKKIDLGIYSGKRHNLGYPVRGQRTLSNGKTQRRLHKFRFYYESDLFSHVFFKNQRKSNKNKKIAKLIAKKKKESIAKTNQKVYIKSNINNNLLQKRMATQAAKKEAEKKAY